MKNLILLDLIKNINFINIINQLNHSCHICICYFTNSISYYRTDISNLLKRIKQIDKNPSNRIVDFIIQTEEVIKYSIEM